MFLQVAYPVTKVMSEFTSDPTSGNEQKENITKGSELYIHTSVCISKRLTLRQITQELRNLNNYSKWITMRRKAEVIGALSYNGRTGMFCSGRGGVDWYQIAGRLVQDTYSIVLPYSVAT